MMLFDESGESIIFIGQLANLSTSELCLNLCTCSKQERLEFLYDSGLAVGKGSSDGFKALETLPRTDTASTSASASTSTKVSSHRYKQCYALYTINVS